MSRYLIFDLGTTYFKACLFDQGGALLGVRRAPTPINYFDDGRAELEPESLRRTLLEATAELCLELGPLNDVAAISFASQANSFTLLDEHDQPLLPLLIWNDARARDDDFPLREFSQSPNYCQTTGIASVDYQFMPAKLSWLARREPAIWDRTCKIVSLSDYLTLWMTGRFVTEASVAWLTGLVDVHNAAWWPTSCGMQGVHLSRLPEIVRAGADLGPLLPGVGEELGVPRDCRFIVGCLDQFAGAIGGGNALPGDVSETTGTVLATVRRSKTFQESRRARVLQGPTSTCGEYFQMIFGGPSATLLENYRNLILERPSFEQLDEWAAEATDSNGIVLDRVALERQECRFLNRHAGHSIGNEVYAILETVADNLVEQVGTLCGKQRPTEVRSAGGAARSKLWQRIKSEKLGCPVMASECEEPTSLGAAMLAHRAIHGTSLEQLSEDWIKTRCADDLSL